MPNVIDYLNEEGTRELIRWTNEVSKEWEKSFEDLSIEEVEDAFKDLDESDPLYSPLQQAIEEAKAAVAKINDLKLATQFNDGLMSATDKAHLDDINDITTGVNLLRGTRDFNVGLERGILSNSFYADGFTVHNVTTANGASFYKDEQGFTVFKMERSGRSTASFDPIRTSYIDGLQQGDDITIFMNVKIDDLDKLDNTLLGCVYLTSATTSNFDIRTKDHKPLSGEWHSGKWETLVIHVNISVEPSNVRLALGIAQNGSVHYKCAGVYKGHIENPEWSASPFDVVQVSSLSTVLQKDVTSQITMSDGYTCTFAALYRPTPFMAQLNITVTVNSTIAANTAIVAGQVASSIQPINLVPIGGTTGGIVGVTGVIDGSGTIRIYSPVQIGAGLTLWLSGVYVLKSIATLELPGGEIPVLLPDFDQSTPDIMPLPGGEPLEIILEETD